MGKKKNRHVYGWLVRFLRVCIRLFAVGWDTSGVKTPQGPVVYIVHHRNLFGPVCAVAMLPETAPLPRPWVLHVFLEKESCYHQFYQYTFTQRFGWPRIPAAAAAGILSWIIPGLRRDPRIPGTAACPRDDPADGRSAAARGKRAALSGCGL